MAPSLKVKVNLRLPETLRLEAQKLAEREGVSLNRLLVQAIENYLPYRQQKWDWADEAKARKLAIRKVPKVGKLQPCPCSSGKRYRDCHGRP